MLGHTVHEKNVSLNVDGNAIKDYRLKAQVEGSFNSGVSLNWWI